MLDARLASESCREKLSSHSAHIVWSSGRKIAPPRLTYVSEHESNPRRSRVANPAHGINPEQLEQFRRDGYLVLPAVFNEEEVRRMRAEADRILELILN